jgi:hypothetical protein
MESAAPFVHLLIRDGILIGTYRKNLHINLDMAKQIVKERIRFTSGKKMAAMILSEGVNTIDKPAREYLASEEGTKGLLATAIVVSSPFDFLMGKFFLSVNKILIPSKIFYSTGHAAKWLRQFIIEN